MSKKIAVVGGGFAGLAAASLLAQQGMQVTLYEKNDTVGGRARWLKAGGYTFDMGPSWYWMPDVFERFFARFGKSPADYYSLTRLDPAFRVFFGPGDYYDVPDSPQALAHWVAAQEEQPESVFYSFLSEAKEKYQLAMKDLVYMPANSLFEFLKPAIVINAHRLNLVGSYFRHVRRYFKNPRVISLMEFPILFLGGTSRKTPALFSLMNHAAFELSTWHPEGGFAAVGAAMGQLAVEQGVVIRTSAPVESIDSSGGRVQAVVSKLGRQEVDAAIMAADYAHSEQLLSPPHRNYKNGYWKRKTFSPSCLIFYIGVKRRVPGLQHHNLFFDEAFEQHAAEIYEHPQWPSKPLFYICCPSKTDGTVAPEGHENLFVLMPVAPGLADDATTRDRYYKMVLARMHHLLGDNIENDIDYVSSYSVNDFQQDYNAYAGNAYGLATTCMQTAFLRPSIRNKNLRNLVYSGQLTVPGPGVPPAIISGQIAAAEILKYLSRNV